MMDIVAAIPVPIQLSSRSSILSSYLFVANTSQNPTPFFKDDAGKMMQGK
jgi:hypothetical protein